MTTWLPRWFACLLLPLPFFPVVAAALDDAEIARLVKQLGDDDFDKREAATSRLKEIGEPALDALHKAETSNDAEVRRRAVDIARMVKILCAVQRCASSAGVNPARQLSFQPVAIGAAVEVTTLSEPSMERVVLATPRADRP